MAITKLDSRQAVLRAATAFVGSAVNDSLDTIFPKINNLSAKLYEDRNIMLTGGGTITNTGGTSLSFTSNFILYINSNIAGAAPYTVSIGTSPWSFSADGKMAYITITSRSAGTFVLTTDATSLPAVTSSNQEVFLIAKRVGTDIYFRNGFKLVSGQSGVLSQSFSFLDSNFVINDASDTTKQIAFDAAGTASTKTTIASSQTVNRTITLPDATDTLVAKNTTDFLTNKNIAYTSSTDSTTTGSNASLAAFTTGIVRLTNASLASVSGIPAGSSGQYLIVENKTGNTILINDEETTPVAVNRIQTGASKNISMLNNSTFAFTYDSTSSRWQLTGGSGSGGLSTWTTSTSYAANDVVYYGKYIFICVTAHTSAAAFETDYATTKWRLLGEYQLNYISDTDGSNIGKWVTFADAAQTNPVDGTGGSPISTFAVSTDSTMRGTTNFLFTHSAANRQGEGFSYDFTIDPSDKGKVLQCSFEYFISSGVFADNDMSVWIYDVTNATLIQPAPYLIKNSSLIEKFSIEFQTAINSSSYRLIFHVDTTTATAYTVRFCNFLLGPQAKLYGSPITDWTNYTPTGNWTTNTTYTGRWRRVGDSMEIMAEVSLTGAPGGTAAFSLNLPAGFSIDLTKQTTVLSAVGIISVLDGGTSVRTGVAVLSTATSLIGYSADSINDFSISATQPITFGNTDAVFVRALVPIAGWSSSLVMSNDADTRVVAATMYRTSSNQTISSSSETLVQLNAASPDTHGGANTSSNRYTVQVSGYYSVSATVRANSLTANESLTIRLKQSGTSIIIINGDMSNAGTASSIPVPSRVVYATAGQYFELYVQSAADTSYDIVGTADSFTYMSVQRISGPSQIAASETVSASYSSDAGQSIANSTTTIIDFEDKQWDSHNAVTTGASWKFTAPISGVYSVSTIVSFNSLAWTAGNVFDLYLYKNGSNFKGFDISRVQATITDILSKHGTKTVRLLAGEYIDVRLFHSRGSASGLNTSGAYVNISVDRIGNY